jgi:DNA polymerase epsilon subunit 4
MARELRAKAAVAKAAPVAAPIAKAKAAPRRKGKAPVEVVVVDEESEEEVDTAVALPVGRVSRIIRSDKDVNKVNRDALFAISKCTEIFVETIARQAAEVVKKSHRKTLQYQDFSDAAEQVRSQLFRCLRTTMRRLCFCYRRGHRRGLRHGGLRA